MALKLTVDGGIFRWSSAAPLLPFEKALLWCRWLSLLLLRLLWLLRLGLQEGGRKSSRCRRQTGKLDGFMTSDMCQACQRCRRSFTILRKLRARQAVAAVQVHRIRRFWAQTGTAWREKSGGELSLKEVCPSVLAGALLRAKGGGAAAAVLVVLEQQLAMGLARVVGRETLAVAQQQSIPVAGFKSGMNSSPYSFQLRELLTTHYDCKPSVALAVAAATAAVVVAMVGS